MEPGAKPRNYAFSCTDGNFGVSSVEYLKQFYPSHKQFRARSFEEIFQILKQELAKRPRKDTPYIIEEIVIVTHASKFGHIPVELTRGSGAIFTPANVTALQQRFKRNAERRFAKRRKATLAGINHNTRIIVRGCQLGDSQKGMNALRVLFGGQPTVIAPSALQGFARQRVGRGLFKTWQEAFAYLDKHGHIKAELRAASASEKKKHLMRMFGKPGGAIVVPTQFFIVGKHNIKAWHDKSLTKRRKLSKAAESMKTRLPYRQLDADDPSHTHLLQDNLPVWKKLSKESDPAFDKLSIKQLRQRMNKLKAAYKPERGGMLVRLYRALRRKLATQKLVTGKVNQQPLRPDQHEEPDYVRWRNDAERFPSISDEFGSGPSLGYKQPTKKERARRRRINRGMRQTMNDAAGSSSAGLSGSAGSDGRVHRTSKSHMELWGFAAGQFWLTSRFKTALQKLAHSVSNDCEFVIVGHSDSTGSARANHTLSLKRARSAGHVLEQAGVDKARIHVSGKGETQLLVTEDGTGEKKERQLKRNRRLEITIRKINKSREPAPYRRDYHVPAKPRRDYTKGLSARSGTRRSSAPTLSARPKTNGGVTGPSTTSPSPTRTSNGRPTPERAPTRSPVSTRTPGPRSAPRTTSAGKRRAFTGPNRKLNGRYAEASYLPGMRGLRLFNFPAHGATIRPNHQSALKALIARMSPKQHVIVVGSSSRTDTEQGSTALAKRRARAVVRFLRRNGISKARVLEVRGNGAGVRERGNGKAMFEKRGGNRYVEVRFVGELYGVPMVNTKGGAKNLANTGKATRRGNTLGKVEIAVTIATEIAGLTGAAFVAMLAPVAPAIAMVDTALSQAAMKRNLTRAAARFGFRLGAQALPAVMKHGVKRLAAGGGHLWYFASNPADIERWVRLSPGIHPNALNRAIEASMISLSKAANTQMDKVEKLFRRALRKKYKSKKKRARMYEKHIVTVRTLAAKQLSDYVWKKLAK